MEWNGGLDWTGLDWTEMVEWNGMEWNDYLKGVTIASSLGPLSISQLLMRAIYTLKAGRSRDPGDEAIKGDYFWRVRAD